MSDHQKGVLVSSACQLTSMGNIPVLTFYGTYSNVTGIFGQREKLKFLPTKLFGGKILKEKKMVKFLINLETYLPQENSALISSTSNEIGFRFKQVKKRTNLAYLRLLKQLVNEVGLDAALNSSVGVPILEAFCSCPISDSSTAQPLCLAAGDEGAEGLNGRVIGRTQNKENNIPPGDKLRHAVRLLMAKGKDAAQDRELNSEFMALIETRKLISDMLLILWIIFLQ
ncbi:hypothetical protein ACTXT7_008829 [Hymenolepis weldensis]